LIPYERFEDATFLKRVFRVLEGEIVCPIEKKTLLRMLTFRRKTKALSEHDHHCIIISTVMAEAWMWGREFFDEIRDLVLLLADKHDLKGANLRVDTYESYVERYKSGSLVTWDPLLDEPIGN